LLPDIRQATLQINRAMEDVVMQAAGQYLWGYARYKQPRKDA
jgi:KDO2-lipid IV(A) lauroyltransferase